MVSGARFAVFFTGAAWCAYLVEQLVRLGETGVTARSLAETSVYLLLVTLLTASALQEYAAEWWTQGNTPQQSPDRPYDGPWTYTGKAPTPSD